ncbi:hypothetical protein [Stenotrophomonas phage CM2]
MPLHWRPSRYMSMQKDQHCIAQHEQLCHGQTADNPDCPASIAQKSGSKPG